MLSKSTKAVICFLVICGIVVVVVVAVNKKDKNLKSRKNRMMRQPMMVRNGRVVSPTMMNSMSEGFSDQYTSNVPISYKDGGNPLYMNSVPDSPKNPWVGSIASIDM